MAVNYNKWQNEYKEMMLNITKRSYFDFQQAPQPFFTARTVENRGAWNVRKFYAHKA